MSLKVYGSGEKYSIFSERNIGTGYFTVRVTPYAYVGVKRNNDGFCSYDIVTQAGNKIMTITNDDEKYIHSSDMVMRKDYFVVNYHHRMDNADMINQVAYDYTGKEIELTQEQFMSNRNYFSHEPVSSKVISVDPVSEDDDVMDL